MRTPKLFWRFINLVTFTDIPIWQKIFLFAGGGIVWFIIIALVGFGAITYVNSSSHMLTDQIVPQIKASQKLIINMILTRLLKMGPQVWHLVRQKIRLVASKQI